MCLLTPLLNVCIFIYVKRSVLQLVTSTPISSHVRKKKLNLQKIVMLSLSGMSWFKLIHTRGVKTGNISAVKKQKKYVFTLSGIENVR